MKRDSRGALIAAACAVAVVLAALWFLRADTSRSLVEPRDPDAVRGTTSTAELSSTAAALDSARIETSGRVGAAGGADTAARDAGPTLVLALVTAVETGLPVGHVFVSAWREGGIVLATPQAIETDEAGYAEIEVEPDVALVVSAQGDGRNTATANVAIPALARGERRNVALAIRTREDLVIHGVVVRRDTREPIGNVQIESQPVRRAGPGPRATTANDGTFRIAVRSFATHALRYEHADFGTALTPARAGNEDAMRPLEVLLEPCAALRVLVLAADGHDTSGWSAVASAPPSSVAQPSGSVLAAPRALTWSANVEGGLALVARLPANAPIDLELRRGSRSVWRTREPLVLAPGETRDVECRAGGASIVGVVREQDGTPAAGIEVGAVPALGDRVSVIDAAPNARTTSAEDGAYAIEGLEPGAWEVAPLSGPEEERDPRRDPAPIARRVLVEAAGGPARHDIVLVRGLVVAGRVLLPDGAPAARAIVAGRSEVGEADAAAATGPDGAFVLGPLATGTWTIEASAEGASPSAAIRCSAGTEGVELRLVAEARLDVRVRDAEGAPVAGALVTVLASDGRGDATAVHTGPDGSARFGRIALAAHGVSAAMLDGRYGAVRDVIPRPGVVTPVEIELAAAGRARVRFDGPQATATLSVLDAGHLACAFLVVRGTTAEIVGPLRQVELRMETGGTRHDKHVVLAREPGSDLVFDGAWR